MAHDPATKARAIALLIAGGEDGTTRAVARATGVPKSTVQLWLDEIAGVSIKLGRTGQGTENRKTVRELAAEDSRTVFNETLMRFLSAAMDMLIAQAEVAGEKGFIRTNPDGAVAIGEFVVTRADRITERLAPSVRG